MVLLYQNHLAAAVVPLVLTHRVARGRAAPLIHGTINAFTASTASWN